MTTKTADQTTANNTGTETPKDKAEAKAKSDSILKSGRFWAGVGVGVTTTVAAGAAFLKWGVSAD